MIDDEVSHVGAKPDKRNIEQMISYIKGALGAVEDDVIVVETGGIGLAVHVPLSLLEELPALGGRSDRLYVFPGAGRCYDFYMVFFTDRTGKCSSS